MANTAFVLNGNVGLLSSRDMLAGNGNYFVVTNPTPGTGIVAATVTAFSATANGLFVIANQGSKTIYLDYLSLIMSGTAPTATTVARFEVFNETGIVTGTGNVATRTPVGVNTGLSQATGAIVQSFAAGQITIPAAASGATRRLQSVAALPTSLGITGDNYVVQFGPDALAPSSSALTAVRATAAARLVTQCAPVVIAPQTTSWINMWWLTQATNAATFEFELSYCEI